MAEGAGRHVGADRLAGARAPGAGWGGGWGRGGARLGDGLAWRQGVGAPEGEEVVELVEGSGEVVPEQEEGCRAGALGRRAGADGGQDGAEEGGEIGHWCLLYDITAVCVKRKMLAVMGAKPRRRGHPGQAGA